MINLVGFIVTLNAVLLDQKTLGDDVDLTVLANLFNTWQVYPLTSDHEIVDRCANADVVFTNKVQLTAAVLTALPKLKLIAVTATGTNNIDLVMAEKLGIKVINVAGYAGASVAQHTFSLLLQLTNKVASYQRFIKLGQWQTSEFFCNLDFPMLELANKNFGIVGFGRLGQASAKLAQAFGMKIMIAERPDATVIRDERVSFEQLLTHADVISLHCPLTDDNTDLFNRQIFAKMKPSALLINTARGGLINEPDLVDALKNDVIAGAALDVLSTEPPIDGNCLLDYSGDNLVITPHIAWATTEARQRLVNQLSHNIVDYLNT